jgi:hypothetical protein
MSLPLALARAPNHSNRDGRREESGRNHVERTESTRQHNMYVPQLSLSVFFLTVKNRLTRKLRTTRRWKGVAMKTGSNDASGVV